MANFDFMDPLDRGVKDRTQQLKKVADKVTKQNIGTHEKINARALLKKVIQNLDYEAKMKALEIIRAEIEAGPKVPGAGSMSKVKTDYTAPAEPATPPYDPTEDPESGVSKLASKKDYSTD